MSERNIQLLSDREHALKRANVYIGSIKPIKEERYILENDKFVLKEIEYIPGLVKIFEEILDNPVDYFVDNDMKAPKGKPTIKIELNDENFLIEDNGGGIPNKKVKDLQGKERWMCEVAWSELKAGSNFDDKNRKSAGTNGMGAALTNFFSKKFYAINCNGGLKIDCKWEDNATKYKEKESKISKTGVSVYVEPDFEKFKRDKFTKNEKIIIETRIKMLAYTYPEIKFILNSEQIDNKEIDF